MPLVLVQVAHCQVFTKILRNGRLTLCLLIGSRCHELSHHHLGPAFWLYQSQLSLDSCQSLWGHCLVLDPNGQIVARAGIVGRVLSPELARGERTNQVENLQNRNEHAKITIGPRYRSYHRWKKIQCNMPMEMYIPWIMLSKLPFGMYSSTKNRSSSKPLPFLSWNLSVVSRTPCPYPRSWTIFLCSSFETWVSLSHMCFLESWYGYWIFLMATTSPSCKTPWTHEGQNIWRSQVISRKLH